jgi:hypothetical protein
VTDDDVDAEVMTMLVLMVTTRREKAGGCESY